MTEIERRSDGSIPEKQDRAGFSKNWYYEIQYKDPRGNFIFCTEAFFRLDDAIDYAKKTYIDRGITCKIQQVTTTSCWHSAVDWPE